MTCYIIPSFYSSNQFFLVDIKQHHDIPYFYLNYRHIPSPINAWLFLYSYTCYMLTTFSHIHHSHINLTHRFLSFSCPTLKKKYFSSPHTASCSAVTKGKQKEIGNKLRTIKVAQESGMYVAIHIYINCVFNNKQKKNVIL